MALRRRTFIAGMAAASSPGALKAAVEPRPNVRLESPRLHLLDATVRRLGAVQRIVGHGNFSLLGFESALEYARNYSAIGAFTRAESSFLEEMFFADASRYGFFGEKVFTKITAAVPSRDVTKVAGTGNYLFKGQSLDLYQRLGLEVGPKLQLTSGVRGMVKQMHLFLRQARAAKGDFSVASRSLAPPGHSFHGVGDFDVGEVGLGRANFTRAFAATKVHARLAQLGYVRHRYPAGNPFGVRYEPWHIKVV